MELRKERAAETANKRREKRKSELDSRIALVLETDIDFSKRGWVSRVADLLEMPHQKVSGWMSKNLPDVYEKCLKSRIRNGNKIEIGCAPE